MTHGWNTYPRHSKDSDKTAPTHNMSGRYSRMYCSGFGSRHKLIDWLTSVQFSRAGVKKWCCGTCRPYVLCVSKPVVNGHSSSTASAAHTVLTAGLQRSRTGAEPVSQHHRGVDSTTASTVMTNSCSSLSHDDRPTPDTQVWHMSLWHDDYPIVDMHIWLSQSQTHHTVTRWLFNHPTNHIGAHTGFGRDSCVDFRTI